MVLSFVSDPQIFSAYNREKKSARARTPPPRIKENFDEDFDDMPAPRIAQELVKPKPKSKQPSRRPTPAHGSDSDDVIVVVPTKKSRAAARADSKSTRIQSQAKSQPLFLDNDSDIEEIQPQSQIGSQDTYGSNDVSTLQSTFPPTLGTQTRAGASQKRKAVVDDDSSEDEDVPRRKRAMTRRR